MSERIVFEVAIDGINPTGLREQMAEYELDLWDLLQEQIETEVGFVIGVRESDNQRTLAAHDGFIVGARIEGEPDV